MSGLLTDEAFEFAIQFLEDSDFAANAAIARAERAARLAAEERAEKAEKERDDWLEQLGRVIMALPMGAERKLGAVEGVKALRARAETAEAATATAIAERAAANAEVARIREDTLREAATVARETNRDAWHARNDEIADRILALATPSPEPGDRT